MTQESFGDGGTIEARPRTVATGASHRAASARIASESGERAPEIRDVSRLDNDPGSRIANDLRGFSVGDEKNRDARGHRLVNLRRYGSRQSHFQRNNRHVGRRQQLGDVLAGDGLQESNPAQAELSGSGNEPFPFGSVADENGERSLSVQKRESLENLIESLGHTMEAGVDRHKSFLLSIADQAAPSFRGASLRAERRRVHTVGEVVDRHGGEPAPNVLQNLPALPGHEAGSPIAEGLEAPRQSEPDSLLHNAQTHRAVG